MVNFEELSDDELRELLSQANSERVRRESLGKAELQVNILINRYHDARNANLSPDDIPSWIQPQGAHDVYPEGREVTHNGKTWVSIIPANVWEPGETGWREVVPPTPDNPNPVAEWKQPLGAHDAYAKGSVVTHNEFTWVSDVDANVWEPGVYGWTKQ